MSGSGTTLAARLPLLQQLQLKHCTLDGLCLDDIITSPQVRRLTVPHAGQLEHQIVGGGRCMAANMRA